MIRKWLKLNTSFIEVLKNSAAPKNLEKKCTFESPYKHFSCYSLDGGTPSFGTVSSPSTGNIGSVDFLQMYSDLHERGDAESQASDESETAVLVTPAKTELFEVKGPKNSAFLIEVQSKDLEVAKKELVRLKGDLFHFDKTIIGWFTMKCILAAESDSKNAREKMRLARIHAISSGCEEVYDGTGKLFFVNSVDRTTRARRILKRLGYEISGILYRFQPREKVSLDDRILEVCSEFVEAVEKLPQVISVTHNL